MTRRAERRRARIDDTVTLNQIDGSPITLAPGPCWVLEEGTTVAFHTDQGSGMPVARIRFEQLDRLLHYKALVFLSWG
jgi:hypothetical protein